MRLLYLLIPLLPFLGFVINISVGKNLPKKISGLIGQASILASFLIVLWSWQQGGATDQSLSLTYFNWIETSNFSINFGFQIDQLSLLMMTIVTGVGLFIHIYSAGYMQEDEGFHRFFAYLNLFIFFMLLLVMGSNLLITYIGWEGVGLCSYLLIGFWFKDHANNDAAKKAFIMNRIGDLGFLIGVLLCLFHFQTIDYISLNKLATTIPIGSAVVTFLTISLFIGATGKSAQIPLYTWLPDAMAGPTPVSALIHAATMVTAGIFLITRLNPMFSAAPVTMDIIMATGVTTALVAAIIATKQNDIKKVLAYSTISQLGYMFAALGAGAFVSGMFHLTTHAFFKALLFLGAGSVIHAMSGEQDIRKMGGLKSKLKWTHLTFLIGTLAIAGVPPFAGFFSKDEILLNVYSKSFWMYIILFATSLLTAFYMFRLYFLTFYGNFRGTEDQAHHLHESPGSMTLPLIILAVLSAFGGFLGIPEIFHLPHALNGFFDQIVKPFDAHVSHTTEILMMLVTVLMILLVIYFSYMYYVKKKQLPDAHETGFWRTAISEKFYIDEAYDSLVVNPLLRLSNWFYNIFDKKIADGVVNQIALSTMLTGQGIRKLQNGKTSFYIFAMVAGIILLLCINYFNK